MFFLNKTINLDFVSAIHISFRNTELSKFENFDIPGPEFDALNWEKTVELVSGIGFKCTL